MSNSEWSKVDFQQFVNNFSIELIIKNAPKILYSKKDKENEAYDSLIAFFFVAGGLLIYISISLFLIEIYFSLIVFVAVIIIVSAVDLVLILDYIKSNVFINPIECWVEIYKNLDYYCFMYYPIFSGRSHPNKAKDIIYKLYQDEVLKSTIDITQIEFYLKLNQEESKNWGGFFFQYGEGKPFREENINQNPWKFFPYEKTLNENFLATANWAHQYEWRDDLALDFDKLNDYAPWVIKKWDKFNLKPLTEEYKEKEINWNLRYIEPTPKLKPWKGELKNQIYENINADKETEIIDEAIEKIIGNEFRVKKLKDLEGDLLKFKSFFRDLNLN